MVNGILSCGVYNLKETTVTQLGKHRGETVPPVNILKLVSTLGVTGASRAIGVSTTTIQTARKKNEASKVIEIAAAGVLTGIANGILNGKGMMEPAPKPTHVAAGEVLNPPKAAVHLPAAGSVVFLVEAPRDKVTLLEYFAKSIGAQLMAA